MSTRPFGWICAALAATALSLPAGAGAGEHDAFFAKAPLTGEVLVRLAAHDDALLARLVGRDDVVEAEHRAGVWPLYSFSLADGVDPLTLASALERIPGVNWAWADRIVPTELHALPLDDTYAENLWHLENVGQMPGGLPGGDIEVIPAWEITDGTGQLIGVIDGGVEDTHIDLRVAEEGWDAVDQDFDANPAPGQSNPGHGTLVAGVAAAIGNNGEGVAGVAYGATVWPVRAIGAQLSQAAIYDAFTRAVDAGATVLNNSWGFVIHGEPCPELPPMPAMNEAMSYAREVGRDGLGTVVVFSAGNSGCEQNAYSMLNDNPGVIAVASISDQSRKWGYSVWGAHVDIGAPSGGLGGGGGRPGLWSTDMFGDPGFNGAGENREYSPRMGGTSGAAPVVTGTVALMLAANPRLLEEDVREVLCATADKVDVANAGYDSAGWSPTLGCGRVNAGAAVTAVANDPPQAPAITFPEEGGDVVLGAQTPIRWAAAEDVDGDALSYGIEVRRAAGDDDDSAGEIEVEARAGLELEYLLRELDWETGPYEVRVAARDLWGVGEWSDWVTFNIVRPIPPAADDDDDGDAGCSSSEGGSAAMLVLLMPLGLLRRRD